MISYKSKAVLKQAIMKWYNQYDEEFDIIPEEMKDDQIEDVSRTPAENWPIKLVGQPCYFNGSKTNLKERLSIRQQKVINGISLAYYILFLMRSMLVNH